MPDFVLNANGTAPELRSTGYALMFGSVMVLGLPLNVVSLWILLRHHSFNSPSIVFMVNLAISDLLLVMSLPMRIYLYATGNWPMGRTGCICVKMLFRNNIRSSSIFITMICVERLLAVVYPLRSRHMRTPANAWKSVLIVWLFVLVLNVPESVNLHRLLTSRNQSQCLEPSPQTSYTILPLSYLHTALVLAMLAVNIVCTCLMSWTLHRRLDDSARVKNKVNVMLIFFMNLIVFAVFFVPVSLIVVFRSLMPHFTSLVCLSSVNCCVDPLLYYFSFDGFWRKKEDEEDKAGHRIVYVNNRQASSMDG